MSVLVSPWYEQLLEKIECLIKEIIAQYQSLPKKELGKHIGTIIEWGEVIESSKVTNMECDRIVAELGRIGALVPRDNSDLLPIATFLEGVRGQMISMYASRATKPPLHELMLDAMVEVARNVQKSFECEKRLVWLGAILVCASIAGEHREGIARRLETIAEMLPSIGEASNVRWYIGELRKVFVE